MPTSSVGIAAEVLMGPIYTPGIGVGSGETFSGEGPGDIISEYLLVVQAWSPVEQAELLVARQARPCRGATSTPTSLVPHSRVASYLAQHLVLYGKALLMALSVKCYMGSL